MDPEVMLAFAIALGGAAGVRNTDRIDETSIGLEMNDGHRYIVHVEDVDG